MRRPVLAFLGFLVLIAAPTWAGHEEVESRLKRDIFFLAAPECEGRGPGTKGIDRAADYIADSFNKVGLKPAAKMGFFQLFTIAGAGELGSPNVVKLRGPLGQEIELRASTDFEVMGYSGSGRAQGPVVFGGHGVVEPAIKMDDYQGIDVAGKVVILIRRTPRWGNEHAALPNKDAHGELVKKQALAEANRALAVLLVNDHSEGPEGDPLTSFETLKTANRPSSIPAVHVRRGIVDAMMRSGLSVGLYEMEQAIDRDLKPRGALLPGWTATIETTVKRTQTPVKNVVGVLEGSGPLAHETVVIGAHYDHLGYGDRTSRTANPKVKAIHHGADDNASGTTVLMELARRFAAQPNRQGRRLVFIAFTAEEIGLLGSQHYCAKEPLFPLKDTVAMVNLDMVGRVRADGNTNREKLIVEGVGTAKSFDQLLADVNGNPGFQLVKKQSGYGPSDHESFYRQKVPVLFFFTGFHEDYHKPSDTADKINVAGMRKVADLAEKTVQHLATVKDRPEYVYQAPTFRPTVGKMPRLGIVPNYEEEKPGVVVGGVSAGGPAAKAGILAGDLIVELAGKQVTNLETYMAILSQQRAGQTIDAVVVRDGKKVTLKVTPQ